MKKMFTQTLNLLLVVGAFMALGIMGATYEAPKGDWQGSPEAVEKAYARGPINDYTKADWPDSWKDNCSTVLGDPSYIPSTMIVANRGFLEQIPFTKENIEKTFGDKTKIVRLYGVCK